MGNAFKSAIFSFLSNLVALWAAANLVNGFRVGSALESYLWVAAVLTLLSIFIRPILRLVLTPVIILTLGLGIVIVNMVIFYLLDLISQSISIEGLGALFLSTIIVGLVNFVIHLFFREADAAKE